MRKAKKKFNYGSHTYFGPDDNNFIVTPEKQLSGIEILEKAYEVGSKYIRPQIQKKKASSSAREASTDEDRRNNINERSMKFYHDKIEAANEKMKMQKYR